MKHSLTFNSPSETPRHSDSAVTSKISVSSGFNKLEAFFQTTMIKVSFYSCTLFVILIIRMVKLTGNRDSDTLDTI